VVHFDEDRIALGPRETDRQVVEVFDELACGMGELELWGRPMIPFVGGRRIPLGPSTVTMRVLMWTLTEEQSY